MPLTNEMMKEIWYIYTLEYYSAVKNNKIRKFDANGWNWKKNKWRDNPDF